MSIDPISPINVISAYTRVQTSGPVETVTHVQHTQKDGGSSKISEVVYTTYNAKGEVVYPVQQGSKVDITV